jgi:quercetin dioxygenase-like cupin family protein
MTQELMTRKRLVLAVSTIVTCLFVWFFAGPTSRLAARQSNFSGRAPSVVESDFGAIRLLFPAGSRSNWHTHDWGQLLMVEEGEGRTQVRGGPVHAMHAGEPWFTGEGVEHWHGAAPDQDALQLTVYEGGDYWRAIRYRWRCVRRTRLSPTTAGVASAISFRTLRPTTSNSRPALTTNVSPSSLSAKTLPL